MSRVELTGKKFGRLTVVGFSHVGGGQSYWFCKCECGGTKTTRAYSITSGHTQSCGCLSRETWTAIGKKSKTHGMSETVEFRTWASIKERCLNKNSTAWKNYGGKGITICRTWRESFNLFYRDMGKRPPGTSIDRINNAGNYTPGNCRWATKDQQMANRSVTLPKQVVLLIEAISKHENITYKAAYSRLRRAAQCLIQQQKN